ncbi:MAG: hypothetical protein AB7P40_23285, partial [Chloroflexota bacterium]
GDVRREIAERLASSAGGRIEAFYYARGDIDLYRVAEVSHTDSVPVAALAAAASVAVTINRHTSQIRTQNGRDGR